MDSEKPSIPAVHALHLANLLEAYGVDESRLLSGSGVDRAQLADPGGRLDVETVARLIARAKKLSGQADLAVQLGLRMQVSAHGFLGFAVMTSATLGEALELAVRYAPTRTDALALRVERGDARVAVVLEELVDLGAARTDVLLALTIGIWQIANALTGQTLRGDVDLAIEPPRYAGKFLRYAPGKVAFGAKANRLVLDPRVLELPLKMADASSQRLAREQCERELSALGEGSLLESRVRTLIPADVYGFRTAEEVARKLGMSTRTLKRRLSEHGLRYSDLVDGMRRDRATSLLREPDLSVDQVAERLGYSDTANFVRAFRRWTGSTPAAFRRAPRATDRK